MDLMNNRVFLPTDKIPKAWFNIKKYLPSKSYPLLLPNGKIADFDSMCHLFPQECVIQGATEEENIPIPKEVREGLALNNRPTPMQRAFRLEKALGVDSEKVKIYFKCEYVSPTGSHKANTAIPQAFYAKKEGLKGLTTETGAGQWGSAISWASNLYGLDCEVYQVRISYQQKPGRSILINSYGGKIFPSPSDQTNVGRSFLKKDPNHPGSLGIAISEAVEACMTKPGYKYSLGSVVDFVVLHQTVIGLEAQEQFKMINEYPDVVIGCFGGGSNFSGIANPFLKDKLDGSKPNLEVIAAEPTACPKMSKGVYAYDYGDTADEEAGMTHNAPICMMKTLGSNFIPASIHAGGLRYHGSSPIAALLYQNNKIKAEAVPQTKIMKAALMFARSEAILPAPESAHAISVAIDQALAAKEKGEKKTILFNLSGHGFFDTSSYRTYLDGKMQDYELPADEVKKALAHLPKVDEKMIADAMK